MAAADGRGRGQCGRRQWRRRQRGRERRDGTGTAGRNGRADPLAGLPLGHALSQQRVSAGAPLDPRAPWASVPAPEATAEPWGWARAHLLLSQARFRADRIQAATNWALITTAAFLACTATTLLAR